MDEGLHDLTGWNQKDHQKYVEGILFENRMHQCDWLALRSSVQRWGLDEIIPLQKSNHGAHEEACPRIWDTERLHHEVKKIKHLLSHGSRVILLCVESRLSHAVDVLAVLLKLFHFLLGFCFHNIFKFLIYLLGVELSLEVLSFRLSNGLILVHLLVNLPLVTTSLHVDLVSLFLIAPVVVDKFEKFGLFILAVLLLLNCQIAQIWS